MPHEITIDRAGRVVIPKPLRDRLGIGPGSRLDASIEEGRLVLSRERSEPALVEEQGLLVLRLPGQQILATEADAARDERLRSLVAYGMRR